MLNSKCILIFWYVASILQFHFEILNIARPGMARRLSRRGRGRRPQDFGEASFGYGLARQCAGPGSPRLTRPSLPRRCQARDVDADENKFVIKIDEMTIQ